MLILPPTQEVISMQMGHIQSPPLSPWASASNYHQTKRNCAPKQILIILKQIHCVYVNDCLVYLNRYVPLEELICVAYCYTASLHPSYQPLCCETHTFCTTMSYVSLNPLRFQWVLASRMQPHFLNRMRT